MAANTSEHGETKSGNDGDKIRQAFSKLPFDKKLSTLVRIELDLLGDAVDAVASAVSKAVDEVVEACAERPVSATPRAGGTAPAS